MSFEDNLKSALASYLRKHHHVDAVSVTDWYEKTLYGGYCDTCAYEETVLEIYYLDSNNDALVETVRDSLAELIRNLE